MRESKLQNKRSSSPWSQLNGSKSNCNRRKMCGFGEPGSRESLPVAVCFALLLEGQLRALVSRQFLCQEDAVRWLNEVSSQSCSGWSPRQRGVSGAAAGAAGWSGGVLYYSSTGANPPLPRQQRPAASKPTFKENPEKLYWKCITWY